LRGKAIGLGLDIEFFQSNHEGTIIDYLQEINEDVSGIVINAGALTHYGLSLRDALTDLKLPVVEVHISNIHAREEFRHNSVISPISVGQIIGLGWHGYVFAIEYLALYFETEGKR
jgi:3-dehydroquinate dehydratase-2